MDKVTKRIRIDKAVDCFMSKIKLKKQQFIVSAINEKLERDFHFTRVFEYSATIQEIEDWIKTIAPKQSIFDAKIGEIY